MSDYVGLLSFVVFPGQSILPHGRQVSSPKNAHKRKKWGVGCVCVLGNVKSCQSIHPIPGNRGEQDSFYLAFRKSNGTKYRTKNDAKKKKRLRTRLAEQQKKQVNVRTVEKKDV